MKHKTVSVVKHRNCCVVSGGGTENLGAGIEEIKRELDRTVFEMLPAGACRWSRSIFRPHSVRFCCKFLHIRTCTLTREGHVSLQVDVCVCVSLYHLSVTGCDE